MTKTTTNTGVDDGEAAVDGVAGVAGEVWEDGEAGIRGVDGVALAHTDSDTRVVASLVGRIRWTTGTPLALEFTAAAAVLVSHSAVFTIADRVLPPTAVAYRSATL